MKKPTEIETQQITQTINDNLETGDQLNQIYTFEESADKSIKDVERASRKWGSQFTRMNARE